MEKCYGPTDRPTDRQRRILVITPTKSSITLLTPDRARESKVHPQVFISGQVVPLDKTPKILGVRFYTHFCFDEHAKDIAASHVVASFASSVRLPERTGGVLKKH